MKHLKTYENISIKNFALLHWVDTILPVDRYLIIEIISKDDNDLVVYYAKIVYDNKTKKIEYNSLKEHRTNIAKISNIKDIMIEESDDVEYLKKQLDIVIESKKFNI